MLAGRQVGLVCRGVVSYRILLYVGIEGGRKMIAALRARKVGLWDAKESVIMWLLFAF